MHQRDDLTLIPDQDKIAKPVFRTYEEQERWFAQFYEELRHVFAEYDRKHAMANEEARHHRVSGLIHLFKQA